MSEQPEGKGGPIPPPPIYGGLSVEEIARLLYGPRHQPSVTAFTVAKCAVHNCTMLDGECAVCRAEAEEADTQELAFYPCPDCGGRAVNGYCPRCECDEDDPYRVDRDDDDAYPVGAPY